MPRSNPLLWSKPPTIWSYGIPVLSVGAALIISGLPAIHLQDAPVSLLLCAVILSAWFGGVGPGLLATALSALAFNYYFLPPIHSLGPKPDEIPRLVIFTVSALFVGSLSAAQRIVMESLRRARDDLKATVQELQNTNAALQAESRERKFAEESLRRSETYLAEAQRLTHTGSWVWQVAGGNASYLSDEWYRIYGFDPEDGAPTLEQRLQRIHPEDRAKWQEAIDRAVGEKSDYDLDFRIALPGAAVKYIHTVGHPVFDGHGELVQFVGSSTDITERKLAEESLRQAQSDLARVNRVTTMGELTASLAHEVNQPIAAAVTNANTCLRWLTRDQPDVEEARAAAMRIVKDGSRAEDIINRIRLLFKK
jgi:PAS domain S-box-containing protein